MGDERTVTLWRPTGPNELALVAETGWSRWPPRLPDQPIFYPVLNREYATKIASDWNVKASGVGYVRLAVPAPRRCSLRRRLDEQIRHYRSVLIRRAKSAGPGVAERHLSSSRPAPVPTGVR